MCTVVRCHAFFNFQSHATLARYSGGATFVDTDRTKKQLKGKMKEHCSVDLKKMQVKKALEILSEYAERRPKRKRSLLL